MSKLTVLIRISCLDVLKTFKFGIIEKSMNPVVNVELLLPESRVHLQHLILNDFIQGVAKKSSEAIRVHSRIFHYRAVHDVTN